MLGMMLNKEQSATLRILCLGAHSDDIEIGCGGTILKLLRDYPDLSVYWAVFGGNAERGEEAVASAEQFLRQAREKVIIVKGFKDSFFPYLGNEIKEVFEGLKREIVPDVIFTHHRNDAHQDHRVICELTWNTFRNHLILEYEIPKFDGDFGAPNFFVHLDEPLCRRKVHLVLGHFCSQRGRDWFTEDTFLSLLRLRGVESRAPGRYAEAFYCRKAVLFSASNLFLEQGTTAALHDE